MSRPTSPSSPGSEDSILPSNPSDSDASDKSNGTSHASESSNDTGPTSRDGEMLLPTPASADGSGGKQHKRGTYSRTGQRGDGSKIQVSLQDALTLLPTPTMGDSRSSGNRNLPGSEAHPGTSLTDVIREDRLLPTPNAGNLNDGQTTEAWRTRKARERAKGYNGNGGGTPIAMAIQLAAEGIFDPNRADLTSSAAGSLASQSPQPEDARPRPTSAGSGPSSPVAFASLNPDGSWSRTYADFSVQESLEGLRSETSSVIWPTSGSMHAGRVFAHLTSGSVMDEPGSSSLLQTPSATDSHGHDNRSDGSLLLPGQVRTLPTPRTPTGGPEGRASKQARGSGGGDLAALLGDLTNPPSEGKKP